MVVVLGPYLPAATNSCPNIAAVRQQAPILQGLVAAFNYKRASTSLRFWFSGALCANALFWCGVQLKAENVRAKNRATCLSLGQFSGAIVAIGQRNNEAGGGAPITQSQQTRIDRISSVGAWRWRTTSALDQLTAFGHCDKRPGSVCILRR
jgi:hypothetical protein